MELFIQDTKTQYATMLALPAGERAEYFTQTMLAPFGPLLHTLGMPPTAEALQCLPLTGREAEAENMLAALDTAKAWELARQAVLLAAKPFEKAGIALPPKLVVGIFLGNPETLAPNHGYTGMGSIPGYIQISIVPSSYTLARLQACVAHEFHHNVLFSHTDWPFFTEVTLARYLAIEGLAEYFASTLFGPQALGPWVTEISPEDLEKTRKILAKYLGVKGFLQVSPYIFGDSPFLPAAQPTGLPYCGGYAAGYQAVKQFFEKETVTIEAATLMDGNQLIEKSGYFN